jgi:Tol biopolymer transport system component/predicted Ser/Thr protein kinase
MPLSAGTRLGPYEIVSPIGAGGMGEVYKGRDTRLDRTVAVKVAQEKFSERFEREARAIAALNHPYICQLYDVGPNYLVMEFVEGEPLKGPLALERAVEYAGQILDALDAAHKKSITHRDLKPANIMLTKSGIKLLDFGLAKQSAPLKESDATNALTEQGQILGTLQYMSPEQLQGKEVDARSDLFSFGCVLYELLTGKRAFDGPSKASVIAAILEREPAALEIARPLDRVVRRSLAKDPDQRFQTARDLKAALSWALEQSPAAAVSRRRSKLSWFFAAAVAISLSIAGIAWWRAAAPSPPHPLIRLNAEIAPGTPLVRAGGNEAMLAISPDGARVAVTLRGADGKSRLYTRLLNESRVTPLPNTENASSPFFSPDGEWIGFFADGKLKKIAVEGGAAFTLCDAALGRGASWGDDGNIIAALSTTGVLSRVPVSGGTPTPATKLISDERTHRWPQFLPGSQAVLFTASSQLGAYDDANIDVISLKTGERKTVERGGFFARYVAASAGAGSRGTGYLIYLHQSTLFAVPFNLPQLARVGVAVPILEDVSSDPGAGGDFAFAQNGTFLYLPGTGRQGGWPISWLDRASGVPTESPLHAPPGIYVTPRFSPDGKRLAFSIASGQGEDIWVKDLDRNTPSRLSFLSGTNRWPVWTPDARNIVFQSTNASAPGLYWIRADGSGEAQRLSDGTLQDIPCSFSPDGKRLAFSRIGNGGSRDIFTAPVEGDPAHPQLGKAELFLGTPFGESLPAFSPDGRWLAYMSDESGSYEVYVRPFPGPGSRWQISAGGGRFPLWSRDGGELLFQTLDERVMVVHYTAKSGSFAADKPRVWSEIRLLNLADSASSYDLAPDGRRLAAMLANDEASGQKPLTHLTFLLNFVDELRRRAPTGK